MIPVRYTGVTSMQDTESGTARCSRVLPVCYASASACSCSSSFSSSLAGRRSTWNLYGWPPSVAAYSWKIVWASIWEYISWLVVCEWLFVQIYQHLYILREETKKQKYSGFAGGVECPDVTQLCVCVTVDSTLKASATERDSRRQVAVESHT